MIFSDNRKYGGKKIDKEKKMGKKMKIEKKWIFSRKCSVKFFKADTIFALIPCYETWHPWKK
jgi:hypothetical protein